MFTPFSVMGCSLELLKYGEQGIITFCKISDKTRHKQLIKIGIKVGKIIILKHKNPIFKIEVNNTTLSIDKELARAIYLRIIDS